MNARSSLLLACALLAWPAVASAQWREGPALDEAVHGAAAATAGGKVYLGGGAGLLEPSDTFSVLDLEAGEWTALDGLPEGVSGHAMAALDGVIYVAGGERRNPPDASLGDDVGRVEIGVPEAPEGPSAHVWRFEVETQVWGEAPQMPTPRAGFSLTALDGRLYASGGGRLIAYDPAEGAWMDLGPEPANAGSVAAAAEGKLYLIGGGEADDAPGVQVDIYDPVAETWSRGPALPAPRSGHAAVTADGRIHVIGGRDADGETLAEHLLMTESGWTVAEPLQSPRAGAAAAALPDGRIVLAGGGFAGGFFAVFTAVDSVEILDPAR